MASSALPFKYVMRVIVEGRALFVGRARKGEHFLGGDHFFRRAHFAESTLWRALFYAVNSIILRGEH